MSLISIQEREERPKIVSNVHPTPPNDLETVAFQNALKKKNEKNEEQKAIYRMVIDLFIFALLPTPPSREAEALVPALRSNTFQNFKLSSAAAVARS